ncbi:MAG: tetratricopeptide repeat protein [Chthoniobacteraceae bacterium]
MASPVETSNPPPSAPVEQHFDLLAFWYLHKTKIIALVALLVVGLAGYSIYMLNERHARESAQNAFAGAKTADDFRRVAAEHPGQIAAANAQLKLAAMLRDEGKLDEANATLRAFVEKYPAHPLLAGAWLSLAQNAEAAGKNDEALTGFQKVTTTFPGSFTAPLALIGQARIQKAKGQTDQAKRTYEQILAQYQNTPFQMEAVRALSELNKPEAPPVAPAPKAAAPAPAPTAPAPATPAPALPVSATPAPATPAPAAPVSATPAPAPAPAK